MTISKFTKEEVKILKKAKKLIEKPQNWVKRQFAQTANGASTSVIASDACNFCLSGAVCRAAGKEKESSWNDLLIKISKNNNIGHIPNWNDNRNRTHGEVIDVLDRCINEQGEKKVRLGMRLEQNLLNKLEDKAKAAGMTKSQYLETLINGC